MEPFDPDFDLIKMDAEIGSYQEDFEPADPADVAATDPEPALFEPGE